MSGLRGRQGRVVCDLRVIQSPEHRGRGIARWSHEVALGLERVRPDIVAAYLLEPAWPPPGAVDELLASGKLLYAGTAPAAAALESAAAYHCFSPFESALDPTDLRPDVVEANGLSFSTTAFDFPPLSQSEPGLSDLSEWRSYMARAGLLLEADAVLAVSEEAAEEAARSLGLDRSACHVVGSGVAAYFAPPASRAAALARAKALVGVAGPFVLSLAGSHGRRNITALIEAFAQHREERGSDHQLVIAGDLPRFAAEHYRQLADSRGLAGRLLLTGYVTDQVLRLLYQSTDLFVLPSLAEVQSLALNEAVACGAPVAVPGRPPFSKMVPEAAAQLDPTDAASMAATIGALLAEPALGLEVTAAASARLSSWDEVAGRAARTFDSLTASRRPRRRAVPAKRLAVVSPLPPQLTGVADYSSRLASALSRLGEEQGFSVDLFADGLDRHPAPEEELSARKARDARTFSAVDASLGYERVLYVLGNSDCHAGALLALRRRPGVVMTHDVRLSGLFTFSAELPGAVPGGLRAAIERCYGCGIPPEVGVHGSLSAAEEERFGLLLLREVAELSERLLLSSESARRLAELDLGPRLAERLGVLPFAVSRLTPAEVDAVAEARAVAKPRPLVATFGILDPSKRPALVVEAVAALAEMEREVDLVFVGLAAEERRRSVEQLAAQLGLGGRVTVAAGLSREEYLSYLARADVAVQLRRHYSGEASGTVSECLSAGVPTIVTDIGWMGELPSSAVRKVSFHCRPDELAARIVELLDDRAAAARLGSEAKRYAASRTFEATAEALLAELGLQ